VAHHDLTEDEREQLTEVVLGYVGCCNGASARATNALRLFVRVVA